MKKEWYAGCCFICFLIVLSFYLPFDPQPSLSIKLARQIGYQIWQNECAGKKEGLTTWNEGEDFASLGIGHFIWYPAGKNEVFKQTFPDLIMFFIEQGVQIPLWLLQTKNCPWNTRDQFQHVQNHEQLRELRQLLVEHIDLQILFMVQRLNKALSTILTSASPEKHSHLIFQFYRLANTPSGLYALLDYLNFKGEGTATLEIYEGQGWGLKQVLEQMEGIKPGVPALEEFVEAAKKILTIRVLSSPRERNEGRWLKGWHNRLETYLRFYPKIDKES